MQLQPINAPALVDVADTPDTQLKPPTLDQTSLHTMPLLRFPANPGTDLWHKPPSPEVHNMPCHMFNIPVSNFHRARVTVTADWTRQYDQGGLILFLPKWPSFSLWVKTGIEFVDGKPSVSTVAARETADWSLLPLSGEQASITIELEREEVSRENGTGTSLWVYLIKGEERQALREMTWVFKEKADLEGLVSVGVYAARPTVVGKDDNEALDVTFTDLTIE